jgi:(p)ppGpp synthase/HD superfamily hydrolase
MNLIQKALEVAFECHKNQKRKGNNVPYMVHILDVAKLLLSESSASEKAVIAGILHDTLEDTTYTAEKLKNDFGPEILELVLFATESDKDSTTSKEQKRLTWKQRKQHTIDACQTATNDQLLILLADKLSNLQSIKDDMVILGDNIWSFFNASKADICWYYYELGNIFRQRIDNARLFKLFDKLLTEVFPDKVDRNA